MLLNTRNQNDLRKNKMREKIFTFQILLILLFFIVKQGNAQELTPNDLKQVDFNRPISFVRGENNHNILIFCNTQDKSIIRKYDIKANYPFKIIGKKPDNSDYDIYEFEKTRFSEIFPKFEHKTYFSDIQINDTMMIDQIAVSHNTGFSNNKKYAAASYSMKTIFDIGRTNVVVFDSLGVEISRFNVDVIPNVIDITDNGDYLSLFYDGWSMWYHQNIMTSGIYIISINDKSVITKKEIQNLSGIGKYGNLIYAGTNGYYNDEGMYVKKRWYFDLSNNKIYSRELDMNCLGKSLLVEDGIIMNCLDGKSYKLTFLEDFKVEELR